MDYARSWDRLLKELRHLIVNEVKSVDPQVVLAFMSFIEEVEKWEGKDGCDKRCDVR